MILALVIPAAALAQDNMPDNSGIAVLEKVMLGSTEQWIQVRGADPRNPVLLFLHGGPGYTHMPFSHYDSELLEEHFLVVEWDQPGAGKSYHEGIRPPELTLERLLGDTHELIVYLKEKFGKEKIFLVGHSFGSVLGLYTVMHYPGDLYGYIGMGQVIHMLRGETDAYHYTLEKATGMKDTTAARMLDSIGPPPFTGGFSSLLTARMLLGKYGGAYRNIRYSGIEEIRRSSPVYTESDHDQFMRGFGFSYYCLWDSLMTVNFFEEETRFLVPVYFFEGRYDFGTPFSLVEEYFDLVRAPDKQIVWFDHSGHFPNLEEPVKYQQRVIDLFTAILIGNRGIRDVDVLPL
jgi:pimeloyl-ACP methyl ester carboxylesterase